jgi:Raf kinase inhibitor-like YbhB/YbcL family protein
MRDFSLDYLRCVNCNNTLEIEILEQSYEIEEGFLICNNCGNKYPIISKIPILYFTLTSYLSNRSQLGGYLMTRAKNAKLKSFIKNSLKKITAPSSDVIPLEKSQFNKGEKISYPQGITIFGKTGYGGPCPPSGTHRYFFKLYALDTMLDLGDGSTKENLVQAMDGHILGQSTLMGKYSRNS